MRDINVTRHPGRYIPTYRGFLGNPFRMGRRGNDETYREAAVRVHAAWLRAKNITAGTFMGRRGGLAFACAEVEPGPADSRRAGSSSWEALASIASLHRSARVIRLVCTPSCARVAQSGTGCHAFALATGLRECIERRS